MVSKRHRLNPLAFLIFLAIPSFANAASLSALSCSSGTVTGAAKDTCTVTLTGATGSGGLAVSLSSSDGAVRVPSSVTVPAGASSAHFAATVAPVKATQAATLKASASGVTKTYALHLKGTIELSGLSCNAGTVTGAATDTCTVTLAASALTGGLAVSLSSSDGAVRVPSSVTVPAGASSAHFTATVAAVKAAQTATLTASASGVTKSCALQLKGSGPALTLQSTSISFGEITLNTPSTQAVTLTSSGTAPLTISAGKTTGTGFSLSGINFPVTLNPGKIATLYIEFNPKATGAVIGTVTLTDNAPGGTATIGLKGTGEVASREVNLTWEAPSRSSDPVVGYNIYRAASGSSSYVRLNSTAHAAATYTDITVAAGKAYWYYVKSVDASGNQSAPSNTFSITIP